MAARRNGNYIIDQVRIAMPVSDISGTCLGASILLVWFILQCTVYSSAQRRKMHCFKGFQRKAVVLVLQDEEWKKRLESRKEKEEEIVPDYVLLEMKGSRLQQ